MIPRPTSPAFCSWRYHQRWTACGLGALLRVRADGEHLLTFRPAAVVDLLRRVEQEVVEALAHRLAHAGPVDLVLVQRVEVVVGAGQSRLTATVSRNGEAAGSELQTSLRYRAITAQLDLQAWLAGQSSGSVQTLLNACPAKQPPV